VSGLRNHQIKMDVIGNNIANVNTYGFKGSRTVFQEMWAQTLQSASASTASGSLAGINPKQIGLGTATAAIDVLHEPGGAQTTDRPLDLFIEGEGFLKVQQGGDDAAPGEFFYTRSGNLYLDSDGYLTTSGGLYVQGVMFFDPSSGPDGYTGDWPNPAIPSITTERWANDASNLLIDEGGETIRAPDFQWEQLDPAAMASATPDLTDAGGNRGGRIIIPPGFYDIAIGQDGVITATDDTGQTVTVGMITLTNFVNPSGLTRVGDNMYVESVNSGVATTGRAADLGVGTLETGKLEMSNVDLSKEFTDMIITQRGFQANSRVITVSDTLLEELVNLKR
jgi:flagellar hook protein FlgE